MFCFSWKCECAWGVGCCLTSTAAGGLGRGGGGPPTVFAGAGGRPRPAELREQQWTGGEVEVVPLPRSQVLGEPFTGFPDQLAALGPVLPWAPPSRPGVSVPRSLRGSLPARGRGPTREMVAEEVGPHWQNGPAARGRRVRLGLWGSASQASRGGGTLPCSPAAEAPAPQGSDLHLPGPQLPLPEDGLWQGSNKVTELEPCVGLAP